MDEQELTPEKLISLYSDTKNHTALLDGIDNVAWSTIKHAHGFANDIPVLLSAFLSENKDHSEFAVQLLHETIWHQGTVYEASAFVVPFLYKILSASDTDVPNKTGILSLLSCLSDGSSYLAIHAVGDKEQEEMYREMLSDEGKVFEDELKRELLWVKKTKEAVAKELSILYKFLAHEDLRIRSEVAYILSYFPERASETIPVLEKASQVEKDTNFKVKIKTIVSKLQLQLYRSEENS